MKNEAIKALETAIEEEKKEQWRVEGRSYLFDAKRVCSSSSAARFYCCFHHILRVPLKLLTSNKPVMRHLLQTRLVPLPDLLTLYGAVFCCIVLLSNINQLISVSRIILPCCWKLITEKDC